MVGRRVVRYGEWFYISLNGATATNHKGKCKFNYYKTSVLHWLNLMVIEVFRFVSVSQKLQNGHKYQSFSTILPDTPSHPNTSCARSAINRNSECYWLILSVPKTMYLTLIFSLFYYYFPQLPLEIGFIYTTLGVSFFTT